MPSITPSSTIVTRATLESGDAEILVQADAPDLPLLTEEARRKSLEDILSSHPAGDLWVFAYGSLIWNPAIKTVERRLTRLDGWRRSFCLSMPVGRGTPENPGLALGLVRGGACDGVAYRLAQADIASELRILWRREMLLGGYRPEWVDLTNEDGASLGSAITFIVDVECPLYVGDTSASALVQKLSAAVGGWGSSADYLFQTRDALRSMGIPDPELEFLGGLVEAQKQAWSFDEAA